MNHPLFLEYFVSLFHSFPPETPIPSWTCQGHWHFAIVHLLSGDRLDFFQFPFFSLFSRMIVSLLSLRAQLLPSLQMLASLLRSFHYSFKSWGQRGRSQGVCLALSQFRFDPQYHTWSSNSRSDLRASESDLSTAICGPQII